MHRSIHIDLSIALLVNEALSDKAHTTSTSKLDLNIGQRISLLLS